MAARTISKASKKASSKAPRNAALKKTTLSKKISKGKLISRKATVSKTAPKKASPSKKVALEPPAKRKTRSSMGSNKASSKTIGAPGNKQSKTFRRKPMPNGRSLLLQLPAELRNEIYEMVAADSGAMLRQGKLASRSSLTRVSKQVHEEYQSVLTVSASPITTEVKDFDFSHVVRFLNKLSERELNTLPTMNIPSEREIQVHLKISPKCPENSEKLHSWLLRCENSNKKGTNINVLYAAEVLPGRVYMTGYYPDYGIFTGRSRALLVRDRLSKLLQKLEEGRLQQECRKIHGALVALCWSTRFIP